MRKAPCFDCENNRVNKTCRKECERWQEYESFKKAEEREKQKIYTQNLEYQDYVDKAITRMLRGKKK